MSKYSTTDVGAALAAARSLTDSQPDSQPDYDILERFLSRPVHDRDSEWREVRQDERLLETVRLLAIPSLWSHIPGWLDIEATRQQLEPLVRAESERPVLAAKCQRLLGFINKREHLERWPE